MFQQNPQDPYGLNALLGFQFDPAGSPNMAALPPQLQYAPQEAPPIPYSPEGWELSKMPKGEAKAPVPAPEKKGAGTMLTSDQARTIAALTGAGTVGHYPGAPGAAAPRGLAGNMQMQQMAPVAPRKGLGALLYGR